jgi:hypothetical protein
LPFQFHLAADPDHVAAANNLAEALVQSGQLGKARRVIHTAVTTAKKINSPLVEPVQQTRREIAQALMEQN